MLACRAVLLVALASSGCKEEAPATPAGAATGEGAAGAPATKTGGVVVTLFPLYSLVDQLAGDDIKVTLLVPPGVSEHAYSPSPADIRALSDAAVLIVNGGGLDDALAEMYRDHADDGLRLVHLMSLVESGDPGAWALDGAAVAKGAHGVADDADHRHDDEGDHDHEEDESGLGEEEDEGPHRHDSGGVNPHQWLVPSVAARFVQRVADELEAAYPQHAVGLQERERELLFEIAAVDVDYETALVSNLGPAADKRLITFHDAFSPLAEAYGLEVVASIMNVETLDVTPAAIAAARRQIEELGVRAVFIEPQFDAQAAQALEAEGVTLRTLDPLGDPNRSGYESWQAMMRSNLENLVAGLKENAGAGASGGSPGEGGAETGGEGG